MNSTVSPYEDLASAIILRAVKDYRRSYNSRELEDIERFFRSDWLGVLTNIDGKMLIRRLREEKSI